MFYQVVFLALIYIYCFFFRLDLLTATEDLIDFSINVLDTIRLQSHFNDRNRRTNLAMQLKDASDAQKNEFGIVEIPIKPCTVTTTLKYDLALYLDRILQSCKRTKVNSKKHIMRFTAFTEIQLNPHTELEPVRAG